MERAPNPVPGVLIRGGMFGPSDTQEGDNTKTETEVGVMLPQAKERQGLSAHPRNQEEAINDSPLKSSQEAGPANTLNLNF